MSAALPTAPALGPLDTVPMRRGQIVILIIALLLAIVDGYDAMAMAFAAPAVSLDWHLGKAVLGLVLASGLVGMGLGAILISPLADVWGRKRVAMIALILMSLGSVICGFAPTVGALAIGRVITGVGIGTMVSMTTLFCAEFSNIKYRSLAVAAVATIGFPVGAVIGGLVSAAMIHTAGWHWIFFVGAIAGGVLLAVIAFALPETPAFLIARRSPDALTKLNAVLTRLRHAPVDALPPAADSRKRASYRALFTRETRLLTFRLIAINLLVAAAAYYMLSWLPQLITDAGFLPETASLLNSASGLVGILGGTVMGILAGKFPPARLAGLAMFVLAGSLAAIGLVPPTLLFLGVAASLFSFSTSATTGMMYGVMADSFAPLVRATGFGVVGGVGRFASALGPALAGWLFASGMSRADVSLAFAAAPLVAGLLMISLPNRRSGVLMDRNAAGQT